MKETFLEAFSRCGVILKACELSGVPERQHYRWIKRDKAYQEAFRQAENRAIELLEIELRRRACEGYDDPVFFQGQQIGAIRKYSDLLLIFLLKAKRPEVYRDYGYAAMSGKTLKTTTTIATPQTIVQVVHELHDGPPALPPVSSQAPLLAPVLDLETEGLEES